MGRKTQNAVSVARDRATEHATSKGSVIAGPIVAAGVEQSVAVFVHHQWGHGIALPLVAAAIPCVAAGCTWAVDRFSRHRSPLARGHAAVTGGAVGAHLLASLVAGPLSHPLIDVAMLGGGGLVFSWIARQWIASNKDEDQEDRKSRGGWAGIFEEAEISGVKARKLASKANQAKARLELSGGVTVDDLQKERKSLAAILKVPGNGVRINEDPDNAGAADITVVRKNMLRQKVVYTEPSNLGGSAAEPMRVGVYEDGEPMLLPMSVFNGEAALLIIGMTGAGKTNGAKVLMGEKFTRRDVYTIFVDTVKGAQTMRPMLKGLRWIVRDEQGGRALMAALKNKVVPYRAEFLGRKGLSQWQSGCGIPRLDIHVEEGSGLFLGDSNFIRLMERLRSVGIHVVLSMQRPSYVSVDVAARAQFPSVWCFGVADTEDAAFAMPDDVLDAGADPTMWRNEQPGCSYLCAPGIEKSRQVTPGRAEEMADDDLELLAEYASRHGAELDPGTIAAFGELYHSRTTGEMLLAELGQGAIPAQEPATDVVEAEVIDDEETDVSNALAGLPADEHGEAWTPPADDPDSELQPDLDDEITPLPASHRMTFGEKVDESKVSPEQAKERFAEALDELQRSGVEVLRGRDMYHVAKEVGRSKPWVHKRLDELVDAGELERTDAGYVFVRALTPA